MIAPAGCQLIGRWRIIEADLWDRGYLNLGGPATITIGPDNNGEIAFGALRAGLDLSYGPSIVHFTWGGCDEMDEVTGDGHAELLDDGSIEITFAYHNGDEAILKAIRQTSSTAARLGLWLRSGFFGVGRIHCVAAAGIIEAA
ncbi:hypothetical protein [Mesorhizobium sp. M5C.F.Cr.IN.023.01.1.1]|uniref:hypothetical protein n=1 Tax=Mesorhizobium sp. M5C.F.Cr.IN.023.01.1.1 TaxID=2496768 RepID=UPI001FE1A021|nr:hypothetical protein [Mesorhizobium sp. M5C.F.Cr.IN.023.01.1.1]